MKLTYKGIVPSIIVQTPKGEGYVSISTGQTFEAGEKYCEELMARFNEKGKKPTFVVADAEQPKENKMAAPQKLKAEPII